MSKKSELSDLQVQIINAKRQFDSLISVLCDLMDSNQRKTLIDKFAEKDETWSEGDKEFELEKQALSRKKSKQVGDNKQYFAYSLNKFVGLAK